MICWNKIEDFHIEEPTALSLGKFDGVHRGHEALIEHLLEKKKEGLKAVVFTFDIPPKKLTENNNYRVLSTNKEKQEILKERGIDYLLECPFTKDGAGGFCCMDCKKSACKEHGSRIGFPVWP